MIFFSDNPRTIRVRWYFTDLPMLPVPTVYCSANWTAEMGEWVDLRGEVSAGKRPWRNGQRPGFAAVMGPRHFCGTPDQWRGNIPIAQAHFVGVADADPCCNPAPPLPAVLGLQCRFRSGGVEAASLKAHARVTAALDSRGHLPTVLESVSDLVADSSSFGSLLVTGGAVGSISAEALALHSSTSRLASASGLSEDSSATGFSTSTLSALATLLTAPGAGAVLASLLDAVASLENAQDGSGRLDALLAGASAAPVEIAGSGAVQAFFDSASSLTPALASGHAYAVLLSALGVLQQQASGVAQLPITAASVGSLLSSLSARGGTGMALDLVAGIKALAAAKGVLLADEDIIAALAVAAKAPGQSTQVGGSTVSVTCTTAAFSVVTPSGGCGSLPAVVVARFSSGTGSGTAYDGLSSTLTYNSGLGHWTGTVGSGATLSNIIFACGGGTWQLNFMPSGASGRGGSGTVSGTAGATPSLSGTATYTVPTSGTSHVAITRT